MCGAPAGERGHRARCVRRVRDAAAVSPFSATTGTTSAGRHGRSPQRGRSRLRRGPGAGAAAAREVCGAGSGGLPLLQRDDSFGDLRVPLLRKCMCVDACIQRQLASLSCVRVLAPHAERREPPISRRVGLARHLSAFSISCASSESGDAWRRASKNDLKQNIRPGAPQTPSCTRSHHSHR